jgi:hypothetical protein
MTKEIVKIASGSIMFLGLLLLFFGLAYKITSCNEEKKNTEFKKVNEFTGISANTYVTEEQVIEKAKELIRLKDPRIYQDIEQVNDATYLIRAYARKTNNVDLTYNGKIGYVFHEIHLPDQDGKKGPAIGYVMIYESGKVVSKTYNFRLRVGTVVKNDSIYNVAEMNMLQGGLAVRKDNKEKIDWRNILYRLPIESAETVVNLEKGKKYKIVFDFRPDLGLNGVVAIKGQEWDVVPNLGVSLISYRNEENSKYRFLRFGLGGREIDNGFNINFSPILFNLHSVIPFIENTYIGPVLGYDKRDVDLGVSLNLTF